MNPLTLVKRIQNINKKEANLGISEEASWHAKYKDSAYVYVGGIPFDLTEGDLLAVFAQYGEIVDVNLVRDKATGKSKGFAFLAYEDQRSTNLAVDNLNGAQILGRIVRVDHVNKYKKLEEEDEETKQRKREERGVCRAFQRGECNRGDSCKFSHDEQRAANTGWGAEEDRRPRWVQMHLCGKFDKLSIAHCTVTCNC
ncbi:zinc finger CCCH domain-containing protein 42-like [Sesamum indicum]|uniref:Zinc finger CCCH domain-containing protein 42-like n=1 Tax=Sesamum indicum TaxID=4182 RepID=A0A6I9UMB9_SESIN|nr:zinc finger CCCH domain-containing protein 42-like [Sesamum indicum]